MAFSKILPFLFYSTIFFCLLIDKINATQYLVSGTVFCQENEPYANALLFLFEEDFGRETRKRISIYKELKNPIYLGRIYFENFSTLFGPK